MFIFLLILLFLKTSSSHVCRTSVLRVREVPETYRYTYYEAYQGADCLIWCTKSRHVTKTGIRMVQKMFNEFIDECCEGYAQDKTNSINCQPTCNPPCENGICQYPNKCKCNPGYIVDTNNICIPHQRNNSNNSTCPVTPDCEYNDEGDTLNVSMNISTPEDDYNCPLHVKEQCCNNIHIIKTDSENVDFISNINNSEAMDEGNNSTLKSNDSEIIVGKGSPFDYYEGTSDPFCSDECNNCKCVADETWVCEPGWYFNEDKTECLPHCDACVHGICKAPNNCECFEGYHFNRTATVPCIPDCNCSEGCLIPNICMNNSECENCENKCSNEVGASDVGVIKPRVEERTFSKSTGNFEDNRNLKDYEDFNIISQNTFKHNRSSTETKLSGIPIYLIYIAAAIGLLFFIVLVFIIKKKINTKVGNTRKFSFIDGSGRDVNNMTVQYTTTH